MSTIVVVLVAFSVLVVGGIALEWIRAWQSVRLAQARRSLFGPNRSNDDDD